MMTIVAFMVFAATLATSLAVFAYTLIPALPRIAALLSGRDDSAAMPQLVLRDRRAAPRSRPTLVPSKVVSQRAAA